MSGTGKASRNAWLAAVFCLGWLFSGDAMAGEWLLRCATLPLAPARSAQRPLFEAGRLYAPRHSAMFFSHSDSACRWKSPRRHRG